VNTHLSKPEETSVSNVSFIPVRGRDC